MQRLIHVAARERWTMMIDEIRRCFTLTVAAHIVINLAACYLSVITIIRHLLQLLNWVIIFRLLRDIMGPNFTYLRLLKDK